MTQILSVINKCVTVRNPSDIPVNEQRYRMQIGQLTELLCFLNHMSAMTVCLGFYSQYNTGQYYERQTPCFGL